MAYLSKSVLLLKLQHYCAYQERCHSEVRSKLLSLGARGDLVEEVISALITDNYLNESRFACAYVRGKFYQKQWGKQKIVRELKMRNINDFIIDEALHEISENDYIDSCKSLLIKALYGYSKHLNARQKAISFMMNKGYEYDIITSVLISTNSD